MDLMYLPESIAYQSRMYSYGRDDQTWVNVNQKSDQLKKEKVKCSQDEKNCSICKSRQKRVLSNYIRKTRRDSDRGTCIQEEEEEQQEEVASRQQPKPSST